MYKLPTESNINSIVNYNTVVVSFASRLYDKYWLENSTFDHNLKILYFIEGIYFFVLEF